MSDEIKPVGLLAGEGALPLKLITHCRLHNIPIFAVQFKGCDYQNWPQEIPVLKTRLEKVGEIFTYFKKNNVKNVVMVGNLHRPSVASLRPDFRGLKTLGRIAGAFAKGDDNLLRSLKQEIESEGFKVRGIDSYLTDLIAPLGGLTQRPCELSLEALKKGIEAAKKHGLEDKGQSVLLHTDGSVSYEGRDGTTALIRDYGREGSVLIKMIKPQQDPDLDRPTVGIHTLKMLQEKHCYGLVIEANAVLMVDKDDMISYANENALFIEAVHA